jgi:hypothetical protein
MQTTATPVRDLFSLRAWLFLMLAGMLLIALRTPEYWQHPCFYAEDGVIFFRDQMIDGWSNLFHPYNGYINLVPRLTAAMAAVLPVAWQPVAYGVVNVCLQSAAACFFFLPENRFLVRSDGLRFVACLLMVTGFQADEMLDNVLAVQWYMFPVGLLILAQSAFGTPPLSRTRMIWYAVMMALICLTVPLLALLFPLALWFGMRLRGYSRVPAAVMAVLTCVQVLVFRFSATTERVTIPDSNLPVLLVLRSTVATAGAWVYRVLLTGIAGERVAKMLAQYGGEGLGIILCISFGVLAYWISERFPIQRRWLFRGMVMGSFVLIGTSLIMRNLLPYFPDFKHYGFFGGGARYFFVPEWLLIVAAAMVVDNMGERFAGWRGVGAMTFVFGLGVLGNYYVAALPDREWARNASRIEGWKYCYEHHLPRTNVVVPINPTPWAVNLP